MGRNDGSDSMRMWGSLHRTFRVAAGLTHEDVARYVGYSVSLVISIERGIRMPSEAYIRRADEICRANGVLVTASEHLSRQRFPAWFEEYAVEEQRSRVLWTYGTHLVHGLLQTEDYARAVFLSRCPPMEDDDIESAVEARLRRQDLLTRKPLCTLAFVIEESALRRPLGGQATLKGQLEHLLHVAERRNVSLQVMPTSYEYHAGLDGPMSLVETPEHKWLVYLEMQEHSRLLNEEKIVNVLQERYTMIRSQALTPKDSFKVIEQLTGEL